ncbi:metal ABC transporter ATP-binding protein [Vibrio mediterranei]
MGQYLLGDIADVIELQQVKVGYKNKPIFPTLTGTFKLGSLTAIMGDNGVGKTTLLKTLMHTITPLAGDIIFHGDSSKSIAWLPQHSDVDRQFPMTVFDTVAMGAVNHTSLFKSLSKSDNLRIQDAIAKVGVTDLIHRSINTLSGGQFQRMLFARMLVQDADILIMDEPFVGIDTATQQQLLFLIKTLHHQGKTIIAVLHDANIVHQHFPSLLHISQQNIYWGKTAQRNLHHHDCFDRIKHDSPFKQKGNR